MANDKKYLWPALIAEIKAWQKRSGIDKEYIAKAVGVSVSTITRLLKRKSKASEKTISLLKSMLDQTPAQAKAIDAFAPSAPAKDAEDTTYEAKQAEQRYRRKLLAAAKNAYAEASNDDTIKGFAEAVGYNKDYIVTVINAESPVSKALAIEAEKIIAKYKATVPKPPVPVGPTVLVPPEKKPTPIEEVLTLAETLRKMSPQGGSLLHAMLAYRLHAGYNLPFRVLIPGAAPARTDG